jgi:dipeptidyl aminopeptidase/acylaminoacyl peptidase
MLNPPLDLEKLLRVPFVEPEHGFDISPDGVSIAFSWNLTGQWEIYQATLDGSSPPLQLTNGPGGKFSPKYSPDGKSLFYLLDLNGDEALDIYRFDFQSSQQINLTPDTSFSIQPCLSCSPDGQQIAFQSDLSGIFDTYVMPISGGAMRCVFQSGTPNESVHWSPDGERLAVTTLDSAQNYASYLVPLRGGLPIALSSAGQQLNAHQMCWSPDGKLCVFSYEQDDKFGLAIYSLDDDRITWLAAEENELGSPDWSADGKLIAYIVMKGPDTWLAIQALDHTQARLYQIAPGVHYAPSFTPDSQKVIFPFDNYAHPTNLWELTLADGSLRQLTHSLTSGLNPGNFIQPEQVWYPGMDGARVPALLFTPPQTAGSKLPAVIVIHGGPTWLFQNLWYPIFQHMASRGWVVLAPNYRGSTGYGRAWQLANRFDLGGIDTRDVAAGANYLAQSGLVDPRRIAVTGRSHGGYLTMTCMTQYPDRFVGGSAVVPFLNWFTSHERIREDLQHWDIENMGDPQENYHRWFAASPYFFLDRIQGPVQLICGGNDPRCPASESIDARDQLIALGKSVDFVIYPDEGHTFLKIENVVEHELRRAAFLASLFDR